MTCRLHAHVHIMALFWTKESEKGTHIGPVIFLQFHKSWHAPLEAVCTELFTPESLNLRENCMAAHRVQYRTAIQTLCRPNIYNRHYCLLHRSNDSHHLTTMTLFSRPGGALNRPERNVHWILCRYLVNHLGL